MIKRKDELTTIETENLRNGKGTVRIQHIIEGKKLKDKANLFAKITVPIGCSIGKHDHTNDFEVYYILKGRGQVFDDGQIIEVTEGDVIYTADGAEHSIENIGDENLEFVATVIRV